MTFTAGQLGMLAFLNNINDPCTAYTPTLTNFTLGNGTKTGFFKTIGKWTDFDVTLVLGTTSVVGTGVIISLPATAGTRSIGAFYGFIYDTSLDLSYALMGGFGVSATSVIPYWNGGGAVTATTIPWATGDRLHLAGRYENA